MAAPGVGRGIGNQPGPYRFEMNGIAPGLTHRGPSLLTGPGTALETGGRCAADAGASTAYTERRDCA